MTSKVSVTNICKLFLLNWKILKIVNTVLQIKTVLKKLSKFLNLGHWSYSIVQHIQSSTLLQVIGGFLMRYNPHLMQLSPNLLVAGEFLPNRGGKVPIFYNIIVLIVLLKKILFWYTNSKSWMVNCNWWFIVQTWAA